MPKTAWTFIIGGLALSGFPIVTAGFWSKDEILADAWAHEHRVVFFVLALAALLTAFYTGRQIMMTFFGKPRTQAANHASERDSIFAWMTIPLMVLGFFCRRRRLGRHPEKLPAPRPAVQQPVPSLHGRTGRGARNRGGGAAVHGDPAGHLARRGARRPGAGLPGLPRVCGPAQSETPDPLVRPLGRVYRVLANKYYFDELYYRVFVKGAQRLANWLYKFDDLWVIDPIVDGVGKVGRRLSEIGHWFDINIVDRAVNGVGAIAGAMGSALRTIQTGKAQNYLFTVLLVLSIALGVFLLLPK